MQNAQSHIPSVHIRINQEETNGAKLLEMFVPGLLTD